MTSQGQDYVFKRHASSKVRSACERCRKQKLKCDVQRPCTLCVRANVACRPLQTSRWIVETGAAKRGSSVAREHDDRMDDHSPAAKRLRGTENSPVCSKSNDGNTRVDAGNASHRPNIAMADPDSRTPAAWDSSSTMVLVDEAFHHYHANTPEEGETSAFSASQWIRPGPTVSHERRKQANQNPLQRVLSRHLRITSKHDYKRPSLPNSFIGELWALLPNHDSASLLVNNYFNHIHWFMLLFHQRNFRNRFERLYEPGRRQALPAGSTSQVGYVAVLLSVCAISLEYTTASQRQALESQGTDPESLRNKILMTMKLRLLDILSLGSLEAVQTCVLLGSYYLYHGQPELAWPLCGCGLRIAQALNLHRKMASHGADQERFDQHTIAARQRCWWAVYEIETFCSMMYGFPLGISDSDCDVEELNPHDGCSVSTTDGEDPGQPNLLFFKCAMSKLSRIVRCALTDLYGTHRNLDRQNRPIVDDSSRLQSLIAKVADLDERLSQWQEALPTKLRPTTLQQQSAQSSAETGSAESFTEKLFHLQALILKLAYENARILVHRPLLSYKMVITENAGPSNSRSCDDPFQRSVQCCRDAALQVSRIGSNSIFRQVSDTYAVTFVSLHLFTAGVTLCIMTSLDPLSRESHESKLGIRGLMEMQTILKPKSIAAAQGLDILRNLLSLVMAKEISNLFEIPSPSEESSTARDVSTSANHNLDPTSSPPQDEQPILPCSSAVHLSQARGKGQVDSNCGLADTTPALSDVGTDFEVCENPSMAEALLDFEHAIWYPPNIATDEEHPSVSTDDHFTPNYVGQDQAWLWGWNCSM